MYSVEYTLFKLKIHRFCSYRTSFSPILIPVIVNKIYAISKQLLTLCYFSIIYDPDDPLYLYT